MDIISPLMIFSCHFNTYWLLSFLFFVSDFTCNDDNDKYNSKKLYTNNYITYKINWKLYSDTIDVCTKAQFVLLVLIYVFYPYYTLHEFSIIDTLYKTFIATIIEEFYFYYIHRLLHTKFLWKYHSKHHELITPVASATMYASMTENIVCNMLPILVIPLIIQMSYVNMCLWTILATGSAVTAHNGLKRFEWFTKYHSLHHLYRNVNFGVIGIADYIHNTLMDNY